MKLHHLRAVVAIAEQGSLRGAARHLRIAQPTLTRGFPNSNASLGAPLFERRPKGHDRDAARRDLRAARDRILNDVRKAQEEFAQLRGDAVGTVSIGLSSVGHILVPAEGAATLSAQVSEGAPARFWRAITRRSSEPAGWQRRPLRRPRSGADAAVDPAERNLFSGRRAVLCRLGHPFAQATSLKELVGAEWITTSITPKAENELGDLFKLHALPPPLLALRSQSSLTLLTCLANSDLLAMVPAQWVDSPFANRVLTSIRVREELRAPPIIVVKRSDVPLAPAATFLLDLVKRSAGRLTPSNGASSDHAGLAAATQPSGHGRPARAPRDSETTSSCPL